MALVPIVNTRYNFYTVIDEQLETSSDNKRMFHVRCDCGKEEFKRAGHLISGRCKSCKSCASKRTARSSPPPVNFQGCGGLSKTHFSTIKNGAERRNIPFSIELSPMWEMFVDQRGRCALTGVDLILEPAIKGCNPDWDTITASIDRKDNTQGYHPDNVWWVHKRVNRLKNNYSLEELRYWCERILITHGNPEPSSAKEMIVAEKVQRLGDEDSNR